jgi:hypothetical protein
MVGLINNMCWILCLSMYEINFALSSVWVWNLVSDIKEHRQRVFEKRVLRRISGPKRYEVIGGWRKLHNEELNNLYPSPNIIRMIKSRRMRWTGNLAPIEESIRVNTYRILVRKPQGKRPQGRPRRRWMYNIKMVLREIEGAGIAQSV